MDSGSENRGGHTTHRSEEEMAWDAEFANMEEPKSGGLYGTLGDMAKMVAQVPAALVQLPMALLPDDTQKHARAALREGFLALRSLFSAVGDGIESMLSDGGKGAPTVKGPAGTWGTGRHASTGAIPGKVTRIEVQDSVSESGGGDGSGKRIDIDDLSTDETRGLRADIDY